MLDKTQCLISSQVTNPRRPIKIKAKETKEGT